MKRGQEEIVGFVLIIVLVAIALVIFIGISFRNSGSERLESTDVYQFIASSMEITSDCALATSEDYAQVKDLFRACQAGKTCYDGKDSCGHLKEILGQVIDKSWNVQDQGSIASYNWLSEYVIGDTREKLLEIKRGNCTGSSYGSSYPIPAQAGRIDNSLVVCRA